MPAVLATDPFSTASDTGTCEVLANNSLCKDWVNWPVYVGSDMPNQAAIEAVVADSITPGGGWLSVVTCPSACCTAIHQVICTQFYKPCRVKSSVT